MGSDWQETTLGDITEWSSGGTPPKSQEKYWGGGIPWISASSMDGNRYSRSKLTLTQEGLEKGSILLLVRGSILHQKIQVGITEQDVAFNQDVKSLKAKNGIVEPWYLLFWFIANEQKLLSLVENTGIGAGKLDTKVMQNLPIKLPPKSYREKISSFAKAIDDKIELNRQMNQTLEAMAQALFKSWFVDFDPVIDNALTAGNPIPEPLQRRAEIRQALHNSGQAKSLPEHIQKLFPNSFILTDEMGWVPKGWGVSSVGNLIELAYGKSLTAKSRVPGPYPVYGSGGISGFHNQSICHGPAIIVGRKGTVGSIFWEERDCFPIDTVFFVKLKYKFPLYWMYQSLLQLDIASLGADSAVPGVNRNSVYALPITKPNDAVLMSYWDFIKNSVDQRSLIQNQNSTLSGLRDTLLPKLISGELRIPEAEKQIKEAVA